MGRTRIVFGAALVAIGVVTVWWHPPAAPASRARVLVLLDSAARSDPDVCLALLDSSSPRGADAAEFEISEGPIDRSDVAKVADDATQAARYDAVMAVSIAAADIDADAARRLVARGAPVSVVLVPSRPAAPPPLRPARTARVLYAEQAPRWESHFLQHAMCRDSDLLVHTWMFDVDPETPQPRTKHADWPAIDFTAGFASPSALDEYDVLVLGDVGPEVLRGDRAPGRDVAAEIRAWVGSGHGLLVIVGPQRMPSAWTKTALMDVLPVVPVEPGAPRDPAHGFHLELTPDGAAHRVLDVAGDARESRQMWESDPDWTMYWAYPATTATGAATLARVGDDPRLTAIATRTFDRGRVLYVGVDEIWRTRINAGDRWFWHFYGSAIAWLAEPRAGLLTPPPTDAPPGAEALRKLAQDSGGTVCAPGEARDLVTSLARLRRPAKEAAARDPWVVAAGVVAILCGAFFLLRGRAT